MTDTKKAKQAFDPEFIDSVRKKLSETTISHFIDGEYGEGARGETFETLEPSNNRPLAAAYRGHEEDVNRAVAAARSAFDDGTWPKMKAKERRKYLYHIADLIDKYTDELAVMECLDTGQVFRIIHGMQVPRAADNFRFYAERALEAMDGGSYPVDDDFLNYSIRVPVGVAGLITPWNTPFMLETWKMAPALAAGNTVVLKPAEWSPLSAWFLGRIFQEADLPPGVVNIVNGYGEEAGAPLVAHPDVQLISLTGETTTGSIVMKNGADTLKRFSLELGGKSPVIVFDDADLDRALDAVIFGIFSLNGERCQASSRLIVQDTIYDEFVERVVERARNVRVGHPLDPDAEVGPLIHEDHLANVLEYIEAGKGEADLLVGGERVGEEGNYLAPTVFAATNQARIAQEEVFGPFLTVMSFSDERDAIRQANDIRYGLASYVWTKDIQRAHRVAHELQAGGTWINAQNVRHLPVPFGGMKDSGIGREGGNFSFDFYTEHKNVLVPLKDNHIPRYGVSDRDGVSGNWEKSAGVEHRAAGDPDY